MLSNVSPNSGRQLMSHYKHRVAMKHAHKYLKLHCSYNKRKGIKVYPYMPFINGFAVFTSKPKNYNCGTVWYNDILQFRQTQ